MNNLDFVVFAGQSNALGYGNTKATLPPDLASFNYGPTYIRTNDAAYWGQIVPGENTGTPSHPEAWGPEVQFARDYRVAHPDKILLIVKSAKGSTSLAQEPDADWSPASAGELFDQTTARINAARAAGGWPQPTALFWMQGEDDALTASASSCYATSLTNFLAAARTNWLASPGYVGVGRITDTASCAFNLDVRNAQWTVDQADPNMESFKTIGFAMQPDGVHYAAVGHVALGRAFYQAWAT